jgi:REP element-mobilizing transposase RayT
LRAGLADSNEFSCLRGKSTLQHALTVGVIAVTGKWKKRSVMPRRAEASRGGSPAGWYSRGYLPHFDGGQIAQTVTFRLFDSLPQSLLEQWRQELSHLPEKEAEKEERKRIEAHLDRGEGSAWMKEARIAALVQEAMLYFDSVRYHLQAWVVMPNHVHALLTPSRAWELGQILHSWKSYTATGCNRLLGRSGRFWQKESFDRYVRDEKHYHRAVSYIENNPVQAVLVKRPEDWEWSSARWRNLGAHASCVPHKSK